MLNTFFERNVIFSQCFSIIGGQGFDNKCGAQLNAHLSHVIGIGNIIIFKTFIPREEKEDLTRTTWISLDYIYLTNHKPFARIDGTLPSIWMLLLTIHPDYQTTFPKFKVDLLALIFPILMRVSKDTLQLVF